MSDVIVTDVRDFLMRTALYQASEFGRDAIRREARLLLRSIDAARAEEQPPQDAREVNQQEKPVNQGEQRPNMQRYFPGNRGPGRPRKTA